MEQLNVQQSWPPVPGMKNEILEPTQYSSFFTETIQKTEGQPM